MLAAIRMNFARRRAIDAPARVAGSSARDDEQIELSAARAEIWTMMRIGGFDEALVRAALFVLGGERGFFDEHGLGDRHAGFLYELAGRLGDPDHEVFDKLVSDQGAVLCLDSEVAIESLPALLPDDQASGRRFMQALCAVVAAAPDAERRHTPAVDASAASAATTVATADTAPAATGPSQRLARVRRIVSFESGIA